MISFLGVGLFLQLLIPIFLGLCFLLGFLGAGLWYRRPNRRRKKPSSTSPIT